MFSEQSISAVPIIDEDGVVVNLYETVDVIVGHPPLRFRCVGLTFEQTDTCSARRLPELGFKDLGSSQSAIARFSRSSYMHSVGFFRDSPATHQEASRA
jgi:hypothetical protein